jgi:DNA-binding NtrC family response regulator
MRFVKIGYNILITDRNPHVREYLKREMAAAGYRVRLAKNGGEILKWIYHHEYLDLLILDPDLPDIDELSVYKKIHDRIPALPVIIHTFSTDEIGQKPFLQDAIFVEKTGNSVEKLKRIVPNILDRKAS